MPVVLRVPIVCLRPDRHCGVNYQWWGSLMMSHQLLDFGEKVTGDESGV